jgi:hypothetical protein
MEVTLVEIVGPDAEAFVIFADGATGAIPPGGTGAIQLRYGPAATGDHTATLRIEHDAPGGPLTVSLKGRGIAPAVSRDPSRLDFGPQRVDTSSPAKKVTVKNVGTADLHVAGIDFDGAAAADYSVGADSCSGATMAPGKTCTFEVIFSPSQAGLRDAVANISDDAADSPQSVALTGIGTIPVVSVSAAGLDFGSQQVLSDSQPQRVTVKNTGQADLHVDRLDIRGASAGDFLIGADACTGATVRPGATSTFEVIMSPVGPGAKSAEVRIFDDALDSPQRLPVKGVGMGRGLARQ